MAYRRCLVALAFLAHPTAVWSTYVRQPGYDACHGHQAGLDFSHATLAHNNLGGLGPDVGAAELRFNNVTMVNGRSVDCVITNTSRYIRTWTGAPRFTGNIFFINVQGGNYVDLRFRLVDHQSGEPVMLERFYFSSFDADRGRYGSEWVKADSFQAYYVTPTTQVKVKAFGNSRVFRATKRGGLLDNPSDPFQLTQVQADRTVAFLFTYTSEFSLTLGVTSTRWWSLSNFVGRRFLFAGTSIVTCNAEVGVKPLSQADFATTYVINWPGKYHLTQDIVFEPQPEHSDVTPELSPKPDSEIYPQLGGYFLGFFAAVVIQAPSVTFDCNGHAITMSPNFYKRQRFFSLFELGSKPFISAAGPPQFSNGQLSPGDGHHAYNVTIQNCRLGLSSHHAIHGNDNHDIVLQNLSIYDFEVGGIHLNGASNVVMRNIDVGPSLKQTFSAELSHAVFLDHLMHTLLQSNAALKKAREEMSVTLRGQSYLADHVFSKLHIELEKFLHDGSGELADVFGNGTDLPDGSAVYGIVLHRRGPAVHEFGACGAMATFNSDSYSSNILMENVSIHDLAVRTEQWTRTVIDGQQVMGPAGDVFQLTQSLSDDGVSYKGNLLMDAQLAVGALKHHAHANGVAPEETSYYFGGAHVPDTVLEWASGSSPNFVTDLIRDNAFECFGDAMSHVNKGVAGLRIAHVYAASLMGVHISHLSNDGQDDADPRFCNSVEPRYGGKDVFGAVLENSFRIEDERLEVDTATFRSAHGGLVEGIHTVETRRLAQDGEELSVKPTVQVSTKTSRNVILI